ncbi:MAG: GNAT family N-acetyltransferase [Dictyoglomus thermophilum]|uniref:GNAT family N-acetyltransferase n=1 Tax=Dictyoglomus thermophilum TaxID=14 RepID=A0A7V3ZHY8_DICTH|nr:GNAT family N-acetyltransferase [Dictyoglomus thermophilum]MCX7719817.1 GNAT family N-acetyltransferase [Dictyoglomus thermophilum]TYT22729.1 GNAT family N-acetyltransferase [Dictyoglomus thermophilum]
MSVEIKEVKTEQEKKDFIMFPFELYKNDPLWVPPLISEMKRIVNGPGSLLFQSGPHTFFNAYENGKIVGRIAVGIDEKMNKIRNKTEGYVTLFESINNKEVAFSLLDTAQNWLRERKMTKMIGPVSPTNGDDYRGMLVENFEDPPVIYTTYNPPYYVDFFKDYGFVPEHTFVAFKYDLKKLPLDDSIKVIEYAKKKYNFYTRKADYSKVVEEAKILQKILERSLIPLEYDYLLPPTEEEMISLAKDLVKFIPAEFVQIAFSEETPIGFAVAMPDYNQVLKRLNGRLFPLGWLKFLWYKNKINRARVFLLFVVPEFQSKGVPAALFIELLRYARDKGYVFAEGSTININNNKMCREAEGVGGVLYKKFVIFKKEIIN